MIQGTAVLYVITVILVIAFVYSLWRDNRSLWNPPLLILSIIFGYFSLANLMYASGIEIAYYALFGLGFFAVPLIVFLSSVFLLYNGVVLLRREGISKVNILFLILGLFNLGIIIFLGFVLSGGVRFLSHNRFMYGSYLFIAYSFVLFTIAFIGFLLYSIVYSFIPKNKKYDFIIIHGAGLLDGERVTPLLKKRIDKAIEAFLASSDKEIKIIASGGKGSDEKISEAQAIWNYIREEKRIDLKQVILEEKSTTTYENLLYSKEIGERLVKNPHFLFVTNNYHVFRTSTFAKRLGMKGDGLGCSTARYYIPSAFVREFVAICVRYKWLFIAAYAIFFAMLAASYL
ncbi:hypothetical protein EJ419_00055 [Alloscardovia theropitheci]|uniref:DUF218 domain-containing protein n=1 Tax=Alloscardovia theropitheci TaxID=2496842 RepID=A0A4R0QRN9_9BIFI|nr:YdcF family protein [Alloscardovia theropitheci]TCD55034.1 hypothetical protein EJ419_00055 [Alloscardovia theropitheci]